MFSLKPKEGGTTTTPPSQPPFNTNLIKGGFAVALLALIGLGYNAYSSRSILQDQINVLQQQLEQQTQQVKDLKKHTTDMGADIDVVTKRVGVTAQELDSSRKFAEKLKAEQEKAKEQLATEIATKASTSDVAAARQEASSKLPKFSRSRKQKSATFPATLKRSMPKQMRLTKT